MVGGKITAATESPVNQLSHSCILLVIKKKCPQALRKRDDKLNNSKAATEGWWQWLARSAIGLSRKCQLEAYPLWCVDGRQSVQVCHGKFDPLPLQFLVYMHHASEVRAASKGIRPRLGGKRGPVRKRFSPKAAQVLSQRPMLSGQTHSVSVPPPPPGLPRCDG